MSDTKTYFIGLRFELEYEGEEMPCEETFLTPIKRFVKGHIKGYKKTTRIVTVDSKIQEVENEDKDDDL